MATVVMPQLTSHRAIASKSSVNVENTRTGFSSRSGGTATKISLAPISIPPAFGSKSGRSSRHIPFRLRPRLLLLALPLLAWAFSSADFGGCFFGLDIHLILSAQATAKSRKGKHSFNRNQPGMLPQTVTTVWRTKLGTTLLIGFNNSTGLSAYFRYLGISQSPPKRRITPSSSPVWPRGTRALAFKELLPRAFQFSQLRSRFFFDGHQFVASLLSLPSELRFESFLALGVALLPNRGVVFDLLLHHRVEDDRDLVGGRCGGLRGVHFALHPAEIVPQLRLVVMQRICRQSE